MEFIVIPDGIQRCLVVNYSMRTKYAGASVGMRFHLPGKFTPFIGAHVFCGAHEETESADKDGIDNDEDGVIDEYGETKSTGKDYLVGIYPEAGFMFTVSDHVQLVISAKYYVTGDEDEGERWIGCVGLNIKF
ncbi:MAG: hypothetical protein GY714_13800 [Desulfobacterales bacterium]|nr:hypothetical protein [Desulfobacterales bacterium]